MKRIATLLSLLIATIGSTSLVGIQTARANAPEASSPAAPSGDTAIVLGSSSLLHKSTVRTRQGDTIHTRKTWDIGPLGLSVSRDKYTPVECPTSVYTHRWYPQIFDVSLPVFYVALTGMAGSSLDIRSGNSWEWGCYISESRAFSASQRFGGIIGFGLSRSYYRLKGRGVLQVDADGQTVVAPIDPAELDYTKPGINYWSWRLPLALGWQRPKGGPSWMVGVEAELRHHVRSRVHSGGTHKHIIDGYDLDIHPWACNLLLQGSFGATSVFARFSLTDFFGPTTELEALPFCVGIGF